MHVLQNKKLHCMYSNAYMDFLHHKGTLQRLGRAYEARDKNRERDLGL